MSKTTGETNPTAERIVASALELFAERGYGSTSVRAIAQHAGVAQGLMYTYFPSKAALLREIFLSGLRDVQASWREVPEADALENLRALLSESFRLVAAHRSFWRLFYALRPQRAVEADLAEELRGWSALIQVRLTRYCGDLGLAQPEVEARVLFAFIDGVAQGLVLEDDYPLEDVTTALLAHYRQVQESSNKEKE